MVFRKDAGVNARDHEELQVAAEGGFYASSGDISGTCCYTLFSLVSDPLSPGKLPYQPDSESRSHQVSKHALKDMENFIVTGKDEIFFL